MLNKQSAYVQKILNKVSHLQALKHFYIHVSELNRHDVFNIEIWKNKKDFSEDNISNLIAHCSYKIEDDYVRAIEGQDFELKVATVMFHKGLFVAHDYRRKGIATALYVLVEKITGLTVIRSNDMTSDAIKLWNQPNRPFGSDDIL